MISVLPNTGILMDDALDKMRGDALTVTVGGLPEPLVYYIRALESSYLNLKMQEKKRALQEIGWKFDKP